MNKIGRPTKYKKEYCDDLIDFMGQGYSKEAFAGKIGVAVSTIYEWLASFPDFSEAAKIGEARCRLIWEEIGRYGVGAKTFHDVTWKFNMQNRFGWRDKQDTDVTSGGQPVEMAPKVIINTRGGKDAIE